ncbi:hypothetical protein GCM10011322_37590 [Salinarimonas ramus]|uniref:Methyltransferase FkbM domain-containing protein n=2 Tax=Salinarimonas ramus TaxID=690164 RepID=A0A917V7A0_9HYPH|nr:hypothetical protein GCM10011322_37590 [Salinarimonas ramus]
MARLSSLSKVTGGPLSALRLALALRSAPTVPVAVSTRYGRIWLRAGDEQAVHEVLASAEYEPVLEHLPPHARVLDVGAHIGTFALWLAARRPDATMLCVEAEPETFDLLSRNTERLTGVRALAAAAGARDGETVYVSRREASMANRVEPHGTIPVETRGFRTLVSQAAGSGDGTIALAKIDVEGSEEALLADAGATLARVATLVIELHPSLCDTHRVGAVLSASYATIKEIGGRTSSKPLLLCRDPRRTRP